jgi:poly(3-hydroxybutyrate) depolymerase
MLKDGAEAAVVDVLIFSVVVAVLLTVLVSYLLSCAHVWGGVNRSIRHGGLERNYLIYTPTLGPAHSGKRTLLLALHGGGTHRLMIRLTERGFNRLADRDGFFIGFNT